MDAGSSVATLNAAKERTLLAYRQVLLNGRGWLSSKDHWQVKRLPRQATMARQIGRRQLGTVSMLVNVATQKGRALLARVDQ